MSLDLTCKLYQLCTLNKALQRFHSYLTNREQCIQVGTSLSEPLTVIRGVPQGSIVGPMFFSLYMNDLPGVTKFSNIESYVNDPKIYLSSSAQDIHSCLHQISQDLELVAGWCCANQLLINPEKRKLVLFGTRQLVSKLPHLRYPSSVKN